MKYLAQEWMLASILHSLYKCRIYNKKDCKVIKQHSSNNSSSSSSKCQLWNDSLIASAVTSLGITIITTQLVYLD